MMMIATSTIDRAGRPAASAHPLCRSAGAAISRRSCSMLLLFAGFAVASAVVGPATVLLDFEGVGFQPVGDFYGGGGGGPSKDYGITFGGDGRAVGAVDGDALAGGDGAPIANEPSPSTALKIIAEEVVFMTVADGFTAMSFQYTTSVRAIVTVYDGPNLTGNVLGRVDPPTIGRCGIELPECGDPNGENGVWVNVTVPFSGVAKSASFLSIFYLDDMLITLAAPPTNPPTKAPTNPPTNVPTSSPTNAPTSSPTKAPTKAQTKPPTIPRTKAPTNRPTRFPTKAPTSACRSLKRMKGNMKRCMMMTPKAV